MASSIEELELELVLEDEHQGAAEVRDGFLLLLFLAEVFLGAFEDVTAFVHFILLWGMD